jgi:hypothetical protein
MRFALSEKDCAMNEDLLDLKNRRDEAYQRLMDLSNSLIEPLRLYQFQHKVSQAQWRVNEAQDRYHNVFLFFKRKKLKKILDVAQEELRSHEEELDRQEDAVYSLMTSLPEYQTYKELERVFEERRLALYRGEKQ